MSLSQFKLISARFTAAITLFSATSPSSVVAQDVEDVSLFQGAIASDFFGCDARSTSMGNTGIVSARDGSALIYNPANLARVRRIEFRGGVSHFRQSNETSLGSRYRTGDAEDDIRKTRINSLSLTLPVPTYRGSLVFATGVHRFNSFDRAYSERTYPGIDSVYTGSEIEHGGMWKWSAGAGMDISPRLAAGLTLNILTGSDHFDWQARVAQGNLGDSISERESINTDIDYVGVSALAGLTYTVSQAFSVGVTIETPTYLDAEEFSIYDHTVDTLFSPYIWPYDGDPSLPYETVSFYNLTRPFAFGIGASGATGNLLAALDLKYSDWSQLDFDYDDDLLNNSPELRFVKDNLREVIGVNLGAEYIFPNEGVTVRAGYFLDPLPIDDRYVESQRQYLTFGAGFLIDRVMTIDMSYVHGGYELRDMDPGTYFANYKTRRVFVTFAYRV
ncbi:MAG: hypothetical protein AB1752_00165 [Candidatus Zixiibacteriota bacterium]